MEIIHLPEFGIEPTTVELTVRLSVAAPQWRLVLLAQK